MTRLLPALLCLLYASLLLSLRHSPAVLAHWQTCLQLPRLIAGAWALWVVVRMLMEHRKGQPDPARLVGLVMSLGAGLAAVWGLWGPAGAPTWWKVQGAAAVCWLVAGAIIALAR